MKFDKNTLTITVTPGDLGFEVLVEALGVYVAERKEWLARFDPTYETDRQKDRVEWAERLREGLEAWRQSSA